MKFENKYDKVFYYLFIIIPIIDTLNGIMINYNINISIGQIYRVFIIFILISIITYEKEYIMLGILFILIGITTLSFIHFYYHLKLIGIISDLIGLLKLFSIFLIIVVYKRLVNVMKLSSNIISKIFIKIIIILPLTIIIPYMFRVGLNVYSNGAGYKGFYFSNNELSIVLLASSIFSLNYAFKFNKFMNYIIFSLNILALIMLGSKTSLVGLGVVGIIYLKEVISRNNSLISLLIKVMFSISVVVILFNIFKDDIMFIWSQALERQQFFLNKGSSGFTLLFSSRNIYLQNALSNLINSKYFIFKLLLGTGTFYRVNNSFEGKSIEMDFIDIFFSEGILVLIIIIFLLILIYKKRSKEKNIFNYILVYIIFILFSMFAGHVMYSGLAANIFSLVICGMLSKEDIKNNGERET